MSDFVIRTEYGSTPSGAGKVTARFWGLGSGMTRSVRRDHALGRAGNHRAAAVRLADALGSGRLEVGTEPTRYLDGGACLWSADWA